MSNLQSSIELVGYFVEVFDLEPTSLSLMKEKNNKKKRN